MATDVMLRSRPATAVSGRPVVGNSADRLTADRVITCGLVLAFVAAVAQVVTQVIDFQAFDLRIAALNSDVHTSIFGVVSLMAQGAAALVAAVRSTRSDRRGQWLLLAALLGALIVIRAALPDHAVFFVAPLALVFILLWRLTSSDSPRSRAVVLGGLALLVLSFIVHVAGLKIVHALGYGYNTWPYELKGIVKHSTELAGWIAVATGVLAGGLPSAVRRKRLDAGTRDGDIERTDDSAVLGRSRG